LNFLQTGFLSDYFFFVGLEIQRLVKRGKSKSTGMNFKFLYRVRNSNWKSASTFSISHEEGINSGKEI